MRKSSPHSAQRAREAGGQAAAVEVAAQFPLGDRWRARPAAIILTRQPGGKMGLHRALGQRALGLATAVDGTARWAQAAIEGMTVRTE